MTYMKPSEIFNLPVSQSEEAITAHQSAVLRFFSDVFQDVDDAIAQALPKVLSTFGLYEGPVDLAVHAPNTRYLVRQALTKKSVELSDEEEVSFDMLRVSNCGLCLKTRHGQFRILKAPGDGLPKALSEARVRFSTNSQMAFAFAEEVLAQPLALNIFVLWRMDSEFQYVGMDIACPRRTHGNGDIECYWITKWQGRRRLALVPKNHSTKEDLDEITARAIDVEKPQG